MESIKYLKRLLGLMFAAGAVFAAAPAAAVQMGPSGICPVTLGHVPMGGAGPGNATDCNLLITFQANGSIMTAPGLETTYESIEDALFGVANNTSGTIFSFNLTGSGIGGFDGDGINLYVDPPTGTIPNNALDTTGYGGEFAYFTNITANALTVNFIGGIAPGRHGYFSLEGPASINLTITPTVPEPSTLAILGLAAAAMGLVRRRRNMTDRESHES
jgi:hypothetical protein